MKTPPIKFPCTIRRWRVCWTANKLEVRKEIIVPKMTLSKSVDFSRHKEIKTMIGSWYQVISKNNEIIYRQLIDDPSNPEVEVPKEDGTFFKSKIKDKEIFFEVLIPDIGDSKEVQFFFNKKIRTDESPKNPSVVIPVYPEQTGGSKIGKQ